MIPEINSPALAAFAPDSRIWIFQADRALTEAETAELRMLLSQWVKGWKAHAEPVKGWADICFQRFLIFVADITLVPVSGCSMDSLMRFVQRLGNAIGVNWFDRLQVALWQDGKIAAYPLSTVETLWAAGQLNLQTKYFNNTVQTLAAWREGWLIPLQEGWLGERLGVHAA